MAKPTGAELFMAASINTTLFTVVNIGSEFVRIEFMDAEFSIPLAFIVSTVEELSYSDHPHHTSVVLHKIPKGLRITGWDRRTPYQCQLDVTVSGADNISLRLTNRFAYFVGYVVPKSDFMMDLSVLRAKSIYSRSVKIA